MDPEYDSQDLGTIDMLLHIDQKSPTQVLQVKRLRLSPKRVCYFRDLLPPEHVIDVFCGIAEQVAMADVREVKVTPGALPLAKSSARTSWYTSGPCDAKIFSNASGFAVMIEVPSSTIGVVISICGNIVISLAL